MEINSYKGTLITDNNVIYITYDGLLDQLGESQILPYIYEIAKINNRIYILSFEKSNRSEEKKRNLKNRLSKELIHWIPLTFTKKMGTLGKIYDLIRMYIYALIISKKYKVTIVHARGHPSAEVGAFLKSVLKLKFIFDFRGFWVDERVEKGGWKKQSLLDMFVFKYYKRKEIKLLKDCDQLIALTEAVIPELNNIEDTTIEKYTIIPCCSDYKHFNISSEEVKNNNRKVLKIKNDAFVLGYLGSVGSMYRADSFIKLFIFSADIYKDINALVITQDVEKFKNILFSICPERLVRRVRIVYGERKDIPNLLSAIDILTAFSNPTYAKLSMSPTKIGEAFACGIPVISNEGIGDVKDIINTIQGGLVLKDLSDESLKEASHKIKSLKEIKPRFIRERSRELLCLERASRLYRNVYTRLNQ